MTDLKGELASLKIDRTRRVSSPWRWPLLLLLPVVVGLLILYGLRAQQAFSATEVETTTAAVTRDVQPSAGTPGADRLRLRRGAAQGGRVGQDPGPAGGAARGGGQRRAPGRGARPPRVARLRGGGRALARGRAARRRPTSRRTSASSAGRGPREAERARGGSARRRQEPRPRSPTPLWPRHAPTSPSAMRSCRTPSSARPSPASS